MKNLILTILTMVLTIAVPSLLAAGGLVAVWTDPDTTTSGSLVLTAFIVSIWSAALYTLVSPWEEAATDTPSVVVLACMTNVRDRVPRASASGSLEELRQSVVAIAEASHRALSLIGPVTNQMAGLRGQREQVVSEICAALRAEANNGEIQRATACKECGRLEFAGKCLACKGQSR